MLSLMKTCTVKAVSHVTGGGFYENLPRMMKSGYTAKIVQMLSQPYRFLI